MIKYLEAGKIINTHGLRGDVKIESWCDTPDVLAQIKTLYLKSDRESAETYVPLKIERASVHKHMVLAKPENSNSIEDALRLKNKVVFADRNDLPIEEGGHFVADLLGLEVIDAFNGKIYGKISDVLKRGHSDIYEITSPQGVYYMPAVDEFVSEIDLERGIFVKPIGGMFDEV